MEGKRETIVPCQFQPEGVNCTLTRACRECGWNPKVAGSRLLKIVYGEKIRGLRVE